MFMKTFEEKWTAWLDGELSDKELAEFEASLPDKAAAEAEKREVQKLGVLLKEHAAARALTNEDFFNHQLRERVARESAEPHREPAESVATRWTIRRLIWAGATSLALFGICTVVIMREKKPTEQSHYLTQILNARVDPAVNPDATISMFEAKEEKVTVLWTEGLQSLPAEYATK
jgi:anti-sigma factor RsiW